MFFKKAASDLTDGQLIARYKETGDTEQLSELYSRYMHLVYGVCLKYLKDREESKDAVMQIYEKLEDELMKHEVGNFKSWLHVLTKNFCLMNIRAKKTIQHKTEQFKKDVEIFMESSYEMHPDNGQSIETDKDALKFCMEKLNKQQRLCVAQFYLEEKCYQEIAEYLGYDIKKVKSHIQNGKRNLKICLEKSNVNVQKI